MQAAQLLGDLGPEAEGLSSQPAVLATQLALWQQGGNFQPALQAAERALSQCQASSGRGRAQDGSQPARAYLLQQLAELHLQV